MIPFNKPHITGKEAHYMYQAVFNGHISGNGQFTKKCQNYFQDKWQFKKCLLTTSCTDALEMAALLLNIKPGDEVIVPSYTFVSSALAFVRQGARIVFAESRKDHPGIDEHKIEELITPRTRAIVPVHYAGVACDMDVIMQIAAKYNLFVVEDAAQAIDSYYKGRPLGSIGHLSAFSFHETKNIQCGEGGMLVINDERFIKRAEILWEKGTNRAEFFRGEVNKYGWVDIGSSFLPADYVAGFLYAQLEDLVRIQERRKVIWNLYNGGLKGVSEIDFPKIPDYATNNGHMFYCLCRNLEERTKLILHLKQNGISAVFHYLCLHESSYYASMCKGLFLSEAKRYDECLVRLPFFYDMTDDDVNEVIHCIKLFFDGI
ncbi:MAG: dTDP-4-amino-4,6-dideoxygalactose transaminase [Bacteroidales bacterium]